MLDSQEGLFSLFINDSGELGILVLYFLDDFFLDSFLLLYSILHGRALLEGSLCLIKQLLKHTNLVSASLFECHSTTAPSVVIEVAIVAEGLIADATVGRQDRLVTAITHSDFSLGHLESVLDWLRRYFCTRLCSGCCFNHGCRANTIR